jgi:hypothetical protein
MKVQLSSEKNSATLSKPQANKTSTEIPDSNLPLLDYFLLRIGGFELELKT